MINGPIVSPTFVSGEQQQSTGGHDVTQMISAAELRADQETV